MPKTHQTQSAARDATTIRDIKDQICDMTRSLMIRMLNHQKPKIDRYFAER